MNAVPAGLVVGLLAVGALGCDQVGAASVGASLAMGWGLVGLVLKRRRGAAAVGLLLGAWAAMGTVGYVQLHPPPAAETRSP